MHFPPMVLAAEDGSRMIRRQETAKDSAHLGSLTWLVLLSISGSVFSCCISSSSSLVGEDT